MSVSRVGADAGAPRHTLVAVVDAAGAAARDRATIDSGVPSRALMQRAGAAAAAEIARRFPKRLRRGAAIHAGGGNNGGDAWVVARALAAAGVRVTVDEAVPAATDDARAERALALANGAFPPIDGSEGVVVDGLLGTGAVGAPRDAVAGAIARIAAQRARGARVIALDVPSGVDASTGVALGAVHADLTITFGTMKRGLLVARGDAGRIAVVDIGLGSAPAPSAGLVDRSFVHDVVRPFAADAHKGTRGRLAIVGGARGMAGAAILAGDAALRSGIGLVRLVVAPESVPVAQSTLPSALASGWPADDTALAGTISEWADVVLLGPGLGRGDDARALCERVLRAWRGPVVLDADGLTVFGDDTDALAALLGGRAAVLTPHASEFARLAGSELNAVLHARFDVPASLAGRTGATVLLKGVPTVISAPDGRTLVSASGSPALATGGSGDVLAGIVAALLAHDGDPLRSAAASAWLHGRAAERAGERYGVRGSTIAHLLDALARGWALDDPSPRYPVLAELPAVGGTR